MAPTDAEVLLSGPTGVGKELYARLLHRLSPRAAAAFVPVNCGALPNDLFENELFGHVGGAFTGARPRTEGLVTEADRGTLFLDEVDALALASQVKLLRLIQEKEYRRLGEPRTRWADIRIVAATNDDLQGAVCGSGGSARTSSSPAGHPDHGASLARRHEDIQPLLATYVERYSAAYSLPRVAFTPAALASVCTYSWPGNVRELENRVRYLTCLQLPGPVEVTDLPLLDEEVTEGPCEPEPTSPPCRCARPSGSW